MDKRTLGISIPAWERPDITFEAFAQVYDDPRVREITINDDASSLECFAKMSINAKPLPKVNLHKNLTNIDCYENKYRTMWLSGSTWNILLDSDNRIDNSYLDALCAIEKWDVHTAYMPSFAMPLFSYKAYEGVTLTKENIASYIGQPMISTCLNCMNYFVNKEEYLRVWEKRDNPHTADSILQNYNWLAAGNKIYIVPGLHYEHVVHDKSHYKLNNHKTGNLYNEIESKIRELK